MSHCESHPVPARRTRYRLLLAVLLPAWLPVQGCRAFDAPERYLYLPAFEGRVADTPLSDDEIRARGARLVYRFRSVPGLVYVRKADDRMGLPSIEASARVNLIIARARKRPHRVPAAQSTLALTDSEPAPTSLEAGFEAATALLSGDDAPALAPVRVAIIDSGVVPSTPAIADALVGVTNFTRAPSPDQWQDHATAIASVYAGLDWSGARVNSYAPNARLHSIKISFSGDKPEEADAGYGALQLAVALDEAVASGARVVNLSFSYRGTLPEPVALAERTVIAAALAKGVVFVAAAGNAGEDIDDRPLYPARYDLENVVVVGNHSSTLRRAWSSNWGKTVDLTAQGVNIPLSNNDGGFDYVSGTSFSVPVVGSALALYFGVNPAATVSHALADLYATAANAYAQGNDTDPATRRGAVSRYGRLRADALLRLVVNRPGLPLSPATRPPTLPSWRTPP